MPKRSNTKRDGRKKKKYEKPVSLYGIPFEEAVEGLLQVEVPKGELVKLRKRKSK